MTALRDSGPVTRVDLLNGAHAWFVTGYDEVRAVLGDPRFSSDRLRHPNALSMSPEEVAARGAQAPPAEPVPERKDGMFIFMDAPQHPRLRRLLSGQFTVRRMKHLEDHVRELAGQLIEAMRAGGPRADLVQAFALPLPSLVICELLGVDYADRDEFHHRTAIALDLSRPSAERRQASAELRQFMAGLVAGKRRQRGDDIISGLIDADGDQPLTDRQLVDMATTLLSAGHETTANMLALSVFALLEQPDQLALVRADPDVLDNGVDELLRHLSVFHNGPTRFATQDVTVGGVTIRAGDTVVMAVPVANRDERRWPQPDRLDLTRPRTSHLAFGHGAHLCLGQQLARVELRIGLAELVTRLPGLRLDAAASEISLREQMVVYGVHELPVAWH
ncbi:cytochrome P450 [Actinoplanes sp. N902-109]|uniref:cytochrome P450 n=1 Tax=Actinoplanes sp. (strain N902-109) TaxID=649831 RepID=UPI0003296449|nr:cytochrome P450 [Actinoplanes sp. N902-109]AGL16505.1 cytochrome P450 [Actinoplanes sp. N902-109]